MQETQQAKHVALCISNDFSADRRVEKTALSLQDIGWQPTVIGRRLKAPSAYTAKNFRVIRMKLWFKTGALFYAHLNLSLFFKLLGLRLDAIHANDLDTLLAAYLASRIKKIPLVYDSHEFFTEVPELQQNPFARRVWLAIESAIFPKLKHVVTVNNSIATEYQKRYGLKPKVVRNIANRNMESHHFTEKEVKPFVVIMQGAGINIDRGAEELLEAFTLLPAHIQLIIVGKGDVFPKLHRLKKDFGLEENVSIRDAMPYHELMQLTASAHLGATLDKSTNPNYALSLPNKIFDYLRAGLPVLSSDVIEVAHIVNKHQCGVVLETVTAPYIAQEILTLSEQADAYEKLRQNAIKASKHYAWEEEFKIFEQIYATLP